MNSFPPKCNTYVRFSRYIYIVAKFQRECDKVVQNFAENLRWLNPRDIPIVKWNQAEERRPISIQNCGKEESGSVNRGAERGKTIKKRFEGDARCILTDCAQFTQLG